MGKNIFSVCTIEVTVIEALNKTGERKMDLSWLKLEGKK